MRDGLSGLTSTIKDKSKRSGMLCVTRKFSGHGYYRTKDVAALASWYIKKIAVVAPGYDEIMYWSLGRPVLDNNRDIIFINHTRRQLPGNNFAKDTPCVHCFSLLNTINHKTLVPRVGVEPTRCQAPRDFESRASTSSAIPALSTILSPQGPSMIGQKDGAVNRGLPTKCSSYTATRLHTSIYGIDKSWAK